MGGIGAGKTTVTQRLGELGATAIEADRIGHEVLEPGGAAHAAVASRWPQVVVDGRIDRASLAAVVFTDHEQLAELEALTHPAIREEIARRVESIEGPVVVEVPVTADLVGPGWIRLAVVAPWEQRLARAVARGADRADIEQRATAQPRDPEWTAAADHVIVNDGSPEELVAAVDALWRRLTSGG
jgi:dephospho-CoA kinase